MVENERISPRRPLRVQFIIGQLTFGGSERHVVDVASHLDRERFTPQVLCLRRGGPLARTLAERGVECVEAPVLAPPFVPCVAVTRAVKAFAPDVVCLYTYLDKLWGRLAAIWAGVPVIFSSYRTVRYGWYEPWLLKRTAAVAANSRALQEDFRQRYNIDPRRVTFLPNGIDLSVFRPWDQPGDPDQKTLRRKFGVEEGALLSVQVARFNPVKDHTVSLQAFRRVLDKIPNARFALVGHGPLEQTLREQCKTLGIDAAVTFLPADTNVPEIFAAADMAVLSSRSESLPRVLVEAAACAKPILATRVGGCAEVVQDEKSGLLTPPQDPDAMADNWISMLADPQRLQTMGAAGLAFARENHSIQGMTRRFETMLTALTNGEPLPQ